VSTAMEVKHGQEGDLCLDIFGGLCARHVLGGCVERGYVCLVVFGMVEFHDFAGDGGFEGAIVV